MNEDTEARLNMMKREIDALQVAVTGVSRPWYRNIATWVSIIALLFSFGTTYVSYHRADAQDVANMRQELRTLLQRLSALPKENVRVLKEYENDPASRTAIAGLVNQENSFVGRSAADLARRLGPGNVSPAEYLAIAQGLQNSYDLLGANEFYENALAANPGFNTHISSLRLLADLRFIQGAPQAGRDIYRKSLDVFSEYPEYDAFTKTQTNVMTELAWAFSEANMGFFDEANDHIQRAERYVAHLPDTDGVGLLRSSITQLRDKVAAAAQAPASGMGKGQVVPSSLVPAASPIGP